MYSLGGVLKIWLLAAAVTVGLLAGTAGAAQGKIFNPETFTLANGMQVVVITNRRAPVVVHMVWYKVGSADDPVGKTGIAHFFEHLMFKGTKTVPPGEFSKIVARNGGRDNAFTSHDYTAYFQKVARDKLELVMRMESDRMRNLILTDAEVLPERDVVLEERRSRTDNNPNAQLYEAARAALYINHPYRNPVIGCYHEIAGLTTKDALNFYRRFYAPNNAILIVSGDVDVKELRPLAEKYYGSIGRGPDIVRVRTKEPPHRAARRVELRSPRVGQPSISRTYLAAGYNQAKGNEAYALQVLAEILGGSSTSRFYRGLVVKAIAASAGAWYSPDDLDGGTFGISGSPRPGVSLQKVERALDAEIKRIAKDGVTGEEVERARRAMVASATYARDSLRAAPNLFGRALTTGRTIDDVESWPERIATVTVAEVNEAARTLFDKARSVTGILRPGKKEAE